MSKVRVADRDTYIKRALATRPVLLSPGRLTNPPEGLQSLRPSLGPEHRGPHLFMAPAQTPQYECPSPGEGARKMCAHPGVSPGIQSGDNPDHRMEGHQAGRQVASGRWEPGYPGPVTELLWPVSRAVKEIAAPAASTLWNPRLHTQRPQEPPSHQTPRLCQPLRTLCHPPPFHVIPLLSPGQFHLRISANCSGHRKSRLGDLAQEESRLSKPSPLPTPSSFQADRQVLWASF